MTGRLDAPPGGDHARDSAEEVRYLDWHHRHRRRRDRRRRRVLVGARPPSPGAPAPAAGVGAVGASLGVRRSPPAAPPPEPVAQQAPAAPADAKLPTAEET